MSCVLLFIIFLQNIFFKLPYTYNRDKLLRHVMYHISHAKMRFGLFVERPVFGDTLKYYKCRVIFAQITHIFI